MRKVSKYKGEGGIKTSTTPISDIDRGNGDALEEIFIQNQSTAVLYGKFGTGATSSDFHFTLSACSVASDGTGGHITITGYSGIITLASTDLKYTIAYK